ncbi:MAG: sigma-70 family RNA polymerase sigma factor [Deltaproteobacteria bacterium]|nr:sigma-70 family RNA polymerase sigma factor [Deltaproteobacteria bacterium]
MSEHAEAATRPLTREQLGETLDRLYRQHHRAVFHIALRYGLGDEQWAHDIAHDVFVALLDRLPSLDDHDDLDGWLYRVATNRCLRKLRRERFLRHDIIRWLRITGPGQGPSIEGRVFARHELERTRKMLATLPPRERVVVCMCHLDGKSQREACEILGLSKGYVSKLLARGMERLEEALND